MPTPTYDLISTTTLAASASSVVFGSVPQGYRDLRIMIAGTTSGGVNTAMKFNSDSGSNYLGVLMYGTGVSAVAGIFGASTFAYFGALWTTQGSTYADIMDYSATDRHKTLISRYSNAANEAGAMASRWGSTAAITNIELITTSAATYAAGTTFSLYGIAG